MALRDLELLDASVPDAATLVEAVAVLASSHSPALAVLDPEGQVVGIFSEGDLLRAVFPGYLAEVRHTAFLTDDAELLDELAREARDRPVRAFSRPTETLTATDSLIHAAERFLHTGEDALPVVEENGRFLGMLSVSALCRARLERVAPLRPDEAEA